MFTAVIAFTLLAQGDTHVLKSHTAFPTEEACMDSMAQYMTALRQRASETYGENGFLMAGKCIQGDGTPAKNG